MPSSLLIAPNEFSAEFKVSFDLGANPINNEPIDVYPKEWTQSFYIPDSKEKIKALEHDQPQDSRAMNRSDERIDFFGDQIFKVLGAFVKDGAHQKRIDRALQVHGLKDKVSLTHLTTNIAAGYKNPDGSQCVLHRDSVIEKLRDHREREEDDLWIEVTYRFLLTPEKIPDQLPDVDEMLKGRSRGELAYVIRSLGVDGPENESRIVDHLMPLGDGHTVSPDPKDTAPAAASGRHPPEDEWVCAACGEQPLLDEYDTPTMDGAFFCGYYNNSAVVKVPVPCCDGSSKKRGPSEDTGASTKKPRHSYWDWSFLVFNCSYCVSRNKVPVCELERLQRERLGLRCTICRMDQGQVTNRSLIPTALVALLSGGEDADSDNLSRILLV